MKYSFLNDTLSVRVNSASPMKQLIFLFFSLLLLSFSVQTVRADDLVPTSAPDPKPTVAYELPYAGILPDSPFYFLKPLRDKLVGILTTDPLKKAEFELNASDKRLSASLSLAREGKIDLSKDVLSKGENYFALALSDISKSKKQGIVVNGVLERMLLASQKHEEMISAMEQSNSSIFLQGMLNQASGFENQTTQLLLKK